MDAWESVEKQLVDVKNHSWTSLLQCYGAMRSLVYMAEGLPFSVLKGPHKWNVDDIKNMDLQRLRQILKEVWILIQQDSERITAGIYPVSVLQPDFSVSHWAQLLQLWFKGYQLSFRAPRFRKNIQLDKEDREALRDVPSYYQDHSLFSGKNFVDPKTVSLYEHQMELLFLGSMDPMRRLILAPMKRSFRFSQGEGLRFLEIGCGSGRLTRFVKSVFPKAKIVVLDVSSVYLKEAQKNLMDLKRIDFIQGDALELPFKNRYFDAVYSSFVLHDMPLEVRRRIIVEAYRVLDVEGWIGFVDFLQNDDCRELNWVLEKPWFLESQAPIKDYSLNSISGTFQRVGISEISTERGFLSKVVFGHKRTE